MQPTQNTAVIDGRPARAITGTPATDADRRSFDLREAGFLGAIDQDGHPAVNPWSDELVPATVAATLRHAARYLSRNGWVQHSYYRMTAKLNPAACIVGALGMVCYGSPVEDPLGQFGMPGFAEFEAAYAYLEDFVSVAYGYGVFAYNDTPGRTTATVIAELSRAASIWECIDSDTAGGAA